MVGDDLMAIYTKLIAKAVKQFYNCLLLKVNPIKLWDQVSAGI